MTVQPTRRTRQTSKRRPTVQAHRLEGKVRNKGVKARKKPKKDQREVQLERKPQGYTDRQRKDYQLPERKKY